jgi:ribosomal protein S18 acetylase RimI-like enzyme
VKLRYASDEDVPLLAELNHQLIQDERAPNPMSVVELSDRMREWLQGDYRAVIFEHSSTPVAYALLRPSNEGTYLRQFFVHRAHRRRGLGQRAIELLRERVVPAGEPLSLEVLVHNQEGIAFWRALGFREHALSFRSTSAGSTGQQSSVATDYRPAKPSDAEAIGQLHARSWRQHYRGSFSDAFLDGRLPEERLRVWRERLDHAPENQFVQLALRGADLCGFVCVYGAHDPRWGSFVDNLHVASDVKRSGIGASLMRQAGAWLALRYSDLGVYLWVLETNASARRFYERLGAQNAGVTTMETHGGAVVHSCRYAWPRAELLSTA